MGFFSLFPILNSAFDNPAPQPARLPGVVHSADGERSRLRSLHPVVYFIHPLCLSLLVPTDLQGFQASSLSFWNREIAFSGRNFGFICSHHVLPAGFFQLFALLNRSNPLVPKHARRVYKGVC